MVIVAKNEGVQPFVRPVMGLYIMYKRRPM